MHRRFFQSKYAVPCTLVLLWILGSAARFLLALYNSQNPSVMPDEALYLQLSASIFNEGNITFHSQPLHYSYFLYPLLLSPLHFLPKSINLFRAIQVLNAVCMNAAVFPAYCLGKSIGKSKKAGLIVALVAILAPDMVMINHIMNESIVYPMMLTCFALTYQLFCKGCPQYIKAAITGGILAALYYIKPGYIALAAAILVVFAVTGCKKDAPLHRIKQAVCIALGFAAIFLAGEITLHYILQLGTSQVALYATQKPDFSFKLIFQFASGLLVYAIYLPIAFMIIPFALPVAYFKKFKKNNRAFALIGLLTIFFMVLGTIYLIYVNELGSDPFATRLHTRYFSSFLPFLVALCLSPELRGVKLNFPLVAITSFTLSGLFLLEGHKLLGSATYPVDSLLLSAFYLRTASINGRIFLTLAFLMFCLWFGHRLHKGGFTAKIRKGLLYSIMLCLVLHSAVGYQLNRNSMDAEYTDDAAQTIQMAGKDTFYVASDGRFFSQASSAMDVAHRGTLPFIELDDLVSNSTKEGVLQSFTPRDYWVSKSVHPIQIPQKIVMDAGVMKVIELDESTKRYYTDNNKYVILSHTPGKPWLNSALTGFDKQRVGKNSRFLLYDEDLYEGKKLRIQFKVYSKDGGATLAIRNELKTYRFEVTESEKWIEETFTVYKDDGPFELKFSAEKGKVYVKAYLL